MNDIIRLLPDALANQIAAGEVVQRPSSVLKELIENAIDANALHITVIIKDAGKILIQVIDDGKGMSDTDARLSFERHATSKIKEPDDLFSIQTFGFRGEALPSIAAVAQVEMVTRRQEDEIGTKIWIEASEFKKQEYVSAPLGTSISVKNLFFNVPARRKFLKGNTVEVKHLVEEFQRVSLAYPAISFRFIHNDQELYTLGAGQLAKRITSILGKNYAQNIVSLEESAQSYHIKGYVGKPEIAKKMRGEQFFFVNNRFIKHPYLHHAVMAAYKGLMAEELFPFYALFIDLPFSMVDVNVHPTKTEVKFEDEKVLYALVLASVKRALGVYAHAPSFDFNQPDLAQFFPVQGSSKAHTNQSSKDISHSPKDTKSKINTNNWEKLYKELEMDRLTDATEDLSLFLGSSEVVEQDDLRLESRANDNFTKTDQSESLKSVSIFQLNLTYIVSKMPSGLLLIDQHAAHFRILYERYLRQHLNQSPVSQRLLFPQELYLQAFELALLLENIDIFRHLGFELEVDQNQQIRVLAVPPECAQLQQFSDLIEHLLHQFQNPHAPDVAPDYLYQIAHSLAKRQAKKHGEVLLPLEMNKIIDELFACEQPNYSPDGQKICVLLDNDAIQMLFLN
ncbi:MAG: DNA mismatch repair endonuclease MutL [Cytophagales bacterium]|nr:MAG: DNA mismatch repair endonuclease MutL [Cytophagales bacterium]TAF62350.1 MAG: DNA mismatch repair endonuclease MutL [Cytophagales bacterium]